MIIYQATKAEFPKDAFERDIHDVVSVAYKERTGRRVGPSEFNAWKESLVSMARVLNDPGIPEESGVAVEYAIPGSAKRVDLVVSGFDDAKVPAVVIVELKRWEKARRTGKDAIVRARYSGAEQDVLHPCYQAWSYAELLAGFNEAVHGGGMQMRPCAYLRNYVADGEIDHRFYPNGVWCLFETNPKGTRNNRVVVAEHRSIHDPDTGGSYTVKLYQSTKEHRKDGTWRHLEIRLRPDSDDPRYKEIVFGPDAAGSVRIIAEVIAEL